MNEKYVLSHEKKKCNFITYFEGNKKTKKWYFKISRVECVAVIVSPPYGAAIKTSVQPKV